LLRKLAPVVGALARRGAASVVTDIWADDQLRPTQVNFTITAVFGFSGLPLEVEFVFLLEQLALHELDVRQPYEFDASRNSLYVVASMRVHGHRGGKVSRSSGNLNAALS
jgi:hypothetical protein